MKRNSELTTHISGSTETTIFQYHLSSTLECFSTQWPNIYLHWQVDKPKSWLWSWALGHLSNFHCFYWEPRGLLTLLSKRDLYAFSIKHLDELFLFRFACFIYSCHAVASTKYWGNLSLFHKVVNSYEFMSLAFFIIVGFCMVH